MNIPLKQPTNSLANNPTICVDHMKHYLYYTFLSLFVLSGCGGGGGSSSSGGSSSKKHQSCAIANGSGHKVWDKTAKKYSTTCTLVTCNAGFDNDEDSTQCQTTAANYYSPANDKTRTACPTTPHSSATTTTGLSSAKGCYNCDGGYLKNTASNTCEVPSKGKYVNASGNEQICSDPGGTVGGFETFLNNTEGVSNATGCNFSCKSGFVKNTATFTCNIPDTGKYADSSGDEQSCNAITRDPGGFNTFLANMIAVNSAAGCGFTCNTGFLKSGRACNFPRKGKYVDAGIEKSCNNPAGTTGGFNEFSDNTKGVSTANGCNFSCKSGHVKSASDYTCIQGTSCNIANGAGFKATSSSTTCQVADCNAGYDSTQAPTTQCQQTVSGFFSLADDKTRTTCPTPQNSSPTSTTSLSSADGCYTCDGGYLKNTASNACAFPSKGTYVNVGGTEVSCNPITLQGTATSAWIASAAATAITCPFSCSAGFVKSGRACNTPDTGKYADNVGVEQSCDGPTGATGGFKEFLPNTGAVSTAAGCGFSCKSGFVKNTANRTCNIPDIGKYADSSGDEQGCNNPTGATGGFKEFLANTAAVATATGCSFSCNVGFVKKTADSMCEIPDQGKYADNGVEKDCSPITGDTDGFNEFAVNTVAVSIATGCGFSCNAGYMKDSSARECNYPTPGTYVNNQGAESSCTDITRMPSFGSWVSGAATADDACPFSCSAGFVKSGRACNIPDTGNYADGAGAMQRCSTPTGGFNRGSRHDARNIFIMVSFFYKTNLSLMSILDKF